MLKQWLGGILSASMLISTSAPVFAAGTQEIGAPRNVAVPPAAATYSSISILWDKPEDYKDITGYNVYIDGTFAAKTGANETYYTAENLAPDSEHTFTVKSLINNTESEASGEVKARTDIKGTVRNVTEKPYSAAGDGTTNDTSAIQAAIDDCQANDIVLIPEGKTFLTGALDLKSNMTLEVNGTLLSSTSARDFEKKADENAAFTAGEATGVKYTEEAPKRLIWSRIEGWEQYCYRSLINVGGLDEKTDYSTDENYVCENVKIIGKGTITGDSGRTTYAPINGGATWLAIDEGNSASTFYDIQNSDTDENTIKSRIRGRLINVSNAQNVYIKDVTVANPPCWTIHMIYSDNITTNGVTFKTSGYRNGDGWDPDSSSNCTIYNSTFNTGDDCVAIKSGKNPEGNIVARPAKNIKVIGCTSEGGLGLAVGSEMSGGVEDVYVRDCTISNTRYGVELKANKVRGGYIRNFNVQDSTIDQVLVHSVSYNADGDPADTPPVFSDITFKNVNILGYNGYDHSWLSTSVQLDGFDDNENATDNYYIKDVTFEDVTVGTAENVRQTISLKKSRNIKFNNVLQSNGNLPKYTDSDATFTVDGGAYTVPEPDFDGIKGSINGTGSAYTWEIGKAPTAEKGTTYTDPDNTYVELTAGLGNGDSMTSDGINFTASSVKESTTSGQASVADTQRYLLVKPKYDGTMNVAIKFTSGTQTNNRIYYKDFADGSVDFAQCGKDSSDGMMTGSGIGANSEKTMTLDMTSGHTYVLYTYQNSSTIAELSYTDMKGVPVPSEYTVTFDYGGSTVTRTVNDGETVSDIPAPPSKDIIKLSGGHGNSGVLIKAAYNRNNALDSVSVVNDNVTLTAQQTEYDLPEANENEKYFLWDSLKGMKPLGVTDKKTAFWIYDDAEFTADTPVAGDITVTFSYTKPEEKPKASPTNTPAATPTNTPAATPAITPTATPTATPDASGNTAPSAPTGLLTNELENPLNAEEPSFGWLVNDVDRNEIQTAYEIVVTDEVTDETVWDSGKVESAEQSYVLYGGEELDAGHPYSWKVKTWDKDDAESPYSESAYFATGLNEAEWAKAAWISDGTTGAQKAEGTYNHYWYARTSKTLTKTVKKATAYFAGVHDYDLYINGTEIGRGQSFDYASETRYQGWDITEEAKAVNGSFTAGALVRTYGGGQGRTPGNTGFVGYIKLYYEDGSSDTITTNTTDWKVSKTTPYKEINSGSASGTRNGEGDFVEVYTASDAREDFSTASFDASSWTAASERTDGTKSTYTSRSTGMVDVDDGIMTKQPIPELSKVTAYEAEPVEIKVINGVTVADFGVVIPGRPQITFKNGTAGRSVTITGGYILKSDGTIATGDIPQQSTTMTWTYVQKAGEQTYNAWDHLGFRYLQIPECGETFTKDMIKAKIVHTNVPAGRDSTFKTDNETLNNVYELMKRSALYGIQNEFVDTPTREKGQFTDDARNISEASMTTQFEREASRKAINQFLASADRFWKNADGSLMGRYNSVYPNVEGKRDIPEYSVNIPQWVWNYYMNTGDKATLEKAYPYMRATANYISKYISSSTGLVEKLAGGDTNPNDYQYGIVDWPRSGRFGYDWTNCQNGAFATVNMLSKHAFDVVALAAEELGKTSDKTDMEKRSADLKTAINSKLVNSNGLYVDGTTNASGAQSTHVSQHANSYALAFDVVPDDKKDAVGEYIASLGMRQGPMSADILAKGLFNAGENTAALKLFTEPNDYGWANILKQGGSFTWEAWDADGGSTNYSQSHAWGATAASDILRNFAGVKVTKPGAGEIEIAPVYVDLASLDAQVSTERGRVGVNYERTDNSFNITLTIPANVKADVILPNAGSGTYKLDGTDVAREINLGSGVYEFVYNGEINPPEKIQYKEVFEGIRGVHDDANNTYGWEIGVSDTAAENGVTFEDTDNGYIDMTVSLARGDKLDGGVIYGNTSVGDNSGNSANDTKRYILFKPKYDGVLTITASYSGSRTGNRFYSYDFGTDTVDLTKCIKSDTYKLGSDLASGGAQDRTVNMTKGHTYVIWQYTYNETCTISGLSYKYTGDPISEEPKPTQNPNTDTAYEAPDAEKTVTEPVGTAITLDRTSYPLVAGNTSKTTYEGWETAGSEITITAALSSGNVSELEWSVDDTDIAYISSSTNKGTSSVRVKGRRTGETRLAAKLPDGNTAVCYLSVIDNVTRSTVKTLELNTNSLTLTSGSTAELIPIINPKDVFGNGALNTDVAWASSDTSVAAVKDGVVTAVGAGTAKIMVKSADVGRKAYCDVTVTDGGSAQEAEITMPLNILKMTAGDTYKLSSDTDVTWRSDDPSIADVDDNGNVTAYASTKIEKLENNTNYDSSAANDPKKASEKTTVFEDGKVQYEDGYVTIYATEFDGSVTAYTVSVAEAEQAVHDIVLSDTTLYLAAGAANTKQITAAVLPASLIDAAVTWESSDDSVVTVSQGERTVEELNATTLTGLKAGEADITASYGGKTATCHVIVTSNAVKAESVTVEEIEAIDIDEVVELNAAVTPADTTDNELLWISSNADIVSVNDDGMIQGLKNGSAAVYAVAADQLTAEQRAELEALQYERTVNADELSDFLSSKVYGSAEVTVKNSSIYFRNLNAPSEAITSSSVNLLWNSNSKLDTADLAGFNIYVNGTLAANKTSLLGYTANGLTADTDYTFKVEAVKSDESILASEEITAKTKSAPTQIIDVTKSPYNAKGNGKNTDTLAIQKAIDTCPDGGEVYLPAGYTFLSGALYLKSNMTLRVDGILLGSTYSKDYPFMVTRWEGWRKVNQSDGTWANTTAALPDNHYAHSSLINAGVYDEGRHIGHTGAYNVSNLVICGNGQINANGFKLGYNEGINQKTGGNKQTSGTGLPVPMTPALDQTIRGRAISIHNAQNVYMKDILVAYSPSWTIHPIYNKHLTVDDIEVVSRGSGTTGAADDICILNGDGVDPDSSIMVNIFKSYFRTGDDAVAIKTGRDKEGNELKKPSQFIRVTDSENRDSKGGFVTGSENASGVKNILFQNLVVRSTILGEGIRMKSAWGRGGVSENVIIRDIDSDANNYIDMDYANDIPHPASTVPEYRYITLENTGRYTYLKGLAKDSNHEATYLNHLTVRGANERGEMTYVKDSTFIDSPSDKWTKNSGTDTASLTFITTEQLKDTTLAKAEGAEKVLTIDNEALNLEIAQNTSAAEIKAELKGGAAGQKQTYELYDGESAIADSNIVTTGSKLKVTSMNGENTAEYTITAVDTSTLTDNTEIKLADGATAVTAVGTRSVIALEEASDDEIKADITSLYGNEQAYTIADNVLTVTADGNSAQYEIRRAVTWDFTKAVTEKTTFDTVTSGYIAYKDAELHGNGGSDFVDNTTGFHINGTSSATNNRYVKFTAPSTGTVTITAKQSYSRASWVYSTNASSVSGTTVSLPGVSTSAWAYGSFDVTEGTVYYMYCSGSGMEIKSMQFTPVLD